MIDVVSAIQALRPTSSWTLSNPNDLTTLEWHEDNIEAAPTAEEINTELQKQLENAEYYSYQTKRKYEYPAIGDQLDALFHAGVFPTEMAAQIQAVKDKYPKP